MPRELKRWIHKHDHRHHKFVGLDFIKKQQKKITAPVPTRAVIVFLHNH